MASVSRFARFSRLLHSAGSFGYRIAFFSAGLFLLWRGIGDTDPRMTIMGIGLGSICMLQFCVLAAIDYRKARRRLAATKAETPRS